MKDVAKSILLDVVSGIQVPTVGLEDSVVEVEREFEVYGRLTNHEQLEAADSYETQSQWGVYVKQDDGREGGIRVRATNGSKYELTIKRKLDSGLGSDETTYEVDEAVYNAIKSLSESGLSKTRYIYSMGDDLKYEVDVFNTKEGVSDWVKIDIEVPTEGTIDEWLDKLPDLPIELTDVRVIVPGRKNDEDLKFVRTLFDEEFNLPNDS